jgi:AraC-like DNA-binding protein
VLRQRAWVEDHTGPFNVWLLRQDPRVEGHPVSPVLDGLVHRFSSAHWEIAPGLTHRQRTPADPGVSISVVGHTTRVGGHDQQRVEAVVDAATGYLTSRTAAGKGWIVSATVIPGGIGAFIAGSAASLANRPVRLGAVLPLDETALTAELADQTDETARVEILARALEGVISQASPERLTNSRRVAEISTLVATDRSIRRLSDLYAKIQVSPRNLQRLFLHYAGVSPNWVVRRYRLVDAINDARDGASVAWASVASELGYTDPSHLARELRLMFKPDLGRGAAA